LPDTSEGFYEYFVSTPGYLIPRAHAFGEAIDLLPPWFKSVHGQQTRWQWIGLVLSVLALVSVAYVSRVSAVPTERIALCYPLANA
jgi:MscS family membrane protein